MRTVKRALLGAIILLTCCATGNLVQATTVQGFETGDPAVSSIGDASKVGTFQTDVPPQGTQQFLLTTISAMNNEDGLNPVSGVFAVSNTSLQNFFGLSITGGQGGSGVLIPFTVSAGDAQLTFQFDFLSNEPFQSMPRADFAFAGIFNSGGVLQGNVTTLAVASTAMLGNPFGTQTPFQYHTGYATQSFSTASLAPGTYMLGIGVSDFGTADHASGILLDNVALIPEPSVASLTIAGAALMLGLRRRLKRS